VQRGATLSLKPAVVLARKIDALSPAHSTFTIAQSNVLGSQHTAGRGGYGPGPYRAGITASLLTSRGVDLGGMQEVQSNQLAVFRNRMPAYSFWPGTSLGHNGERLQVYWRTDRFTMEKSGSVTYTFASQHIPLPYVLLRDNDSGAEFWVITTHNSAGGMEAQRDSATGVEINLINQLRAGGLPVIITGDMNEHTEFFCRVAASTGMVAANGGSGAGGCHLPPPPLRVDWIMGSGVSFSGYRQDAAGLHRASDHYYLYAEATATSDWFAPGTTP
jgi:endonuclease/exonuclease/phosphatase family metal-dependent hydrolase